MHYKCLYTVRFNNLLVTINDAVQHEKSKTAILILHDHIFLQVQFLYIPRYDTDIAFRDIIQKQNTLSNVVKTIGLCISFSVN